MNGSASNLILYIVNGLVGLVVLLIGVVVRQHQKADEDHKNRMDKEIDRLRSRLHDAESKLAGIEMLKNSKRM